MMSNFQNCLKLPKYVSKRNIALLDANLLLVYLIAQFDINPQDFERTKKKTTAGAVVSLFKNYRLFAFRL